MSAPTKHFDRRTHRQRQGRQHLVPKPARRDTVEPFEPLTKLLVDVTSHSHFGYASTSTPFA